MRGIYWKLRDNIGLSLILFIGLGVEFSNFQAMFYRFMNQYRPDWGVVNHVPAVFLSAFLLLCIVIFGIRRQTTLSWFLALLTCVISFSVYSRIELSWQWEKLSEVHFVVLILSAMLPMLVAYTTHQIAAEEDFGETTEDVQMEELLREVQRMAARKQAHSYQQHPAGAASAAGEKKKYAHQPTDVAGFDNTQETAQDTAATHHGRHSCLHCGADMQNKKKNAKYCSKTCSSHAQRNKRKQPAEHVETDSQVHENRSVQQPYGYLTVASQAHTLTIDWETLQPNDEQVLTEITCAQCGKAAYTHANSPYCSADCRERVAGRTKRKSNFVTSRDEFETAGFVEWANPEHAA